ncbi:PEP-CTERM sorting domain-containing protein [Massilia sp. DJPM01]|uniref:PEP-CTERM sorting domain-containing protein n=1 Tax=Massilia sp. DJPM01 TaxID=3024404 RepID=UPI00259DF688|nr:PEP-CTERM sorting domain-containing protein [Massilia sp. DJPM01]MDM5178763.1 PEP-CTERM sorting domain-containing protein [Massilia sp. DJPM01]
MNLMTRLSAMAALVLAVPANAQTPERIETAAFSMVNQWGDATDALLSDANGVTRISLNSAAASLNAATSAYLDGNFYGGLFEFSVHDGYRVTGFSFSGSFEGLLHVPPNPDGTPGNGLAYNSGNVEFSAGSRPYGILYGEHSMRVDMLDGAMPFDMSIGQLSLTTDFNLSMQGLILVSAYPTVTPENPSGIDAFASLRVVNPVFTIYTMAVPEPDHYAMLLAGLALVGVLRRRQKNIGHFAKLTE